MTRQEFIEKFVLAAAPKWCSPSDSNAICLNVATASVYYDLIHADDPAPEEPATHWVRMAERMPTLADAGPKGNVGFSPCWRHAEDRQVLEFYWNAFHESRYCPDCYWCRLPGVGE